MTKIRIHGYGGQGIITSAEILALAGWQAGLWAQAMPFFGPERTGTPVQSAVRFSETRIISREPIDSADWLIVNAEKLLADESTFMSIGKSCRIIVNSSQSGDQLAKKYHLLNVRIFPINATKIAEDLGNPLLAGSVLLGYFARVTGMLSLAGLNHAIADKFAKNKSETRLLNQRAAKIGYDNN